MKRILILLACLCGLAIPAAHAQDPTPEQRAQMARMETLLKSLHPVTGQVPIAAAHAALQLGQDYYFLPADEAKRVLVEGWGNPADSVGDVLGIVFPAGKTFLDDTWGAVLSYEATGYVEDSDAESADYDAMLAQSRANEEEINKRRSEAGFPAQHLVGWAQPPSYDRGSHSLIWARDVRFADQQVDTLNYDVRLLGRSGVLSMNMVASMPQLPQVRAAAEQFARTASFEAGSRYADYNAASDRKADFGVAGLVAAGVGVAAAKKLGLLAIILGFGKKLIVLVAIAGAAVLNWLRRLFGRGTNET